MRLTEPILLTPINRCRIVALSHFTLVATVRQMRQPFATVRQLFATKQNATVRQSTIAHLNY